MFEASEGCRHSGSRKAETSKVLKKREKKRKIYSHHPPTKCLLLPETSLTSAVSDCCKRAIKERSSCVSSRPHKFTRRLKMCTQLSRSPRQQSRFLIWSLQINLSAWHGPGLLTARLDLSDTPCATLHHLLNDGHRAWCGQTRRAEGKFITLETLQTRPYLHAFLDN